MPQLFTQVRTATCLHLPCGAEESEADNKKLLRCSGCRAVTYCNKEHQMGDWPRHKQYCNLIKKLKATLDKEEKKLRDLKEGDMFMPVPVFEEGEGHFWGIHGTRPYMRARSALIHELILKLPTHESTKLAVKHARDMLRLCRGDNLGIRDLVPGCYIRLGKDQEAYDFLKWWETQTADYEWGDTDLPYLNLKDEDIMEEPIFMERTYDVAMKISLLLLKLRMLFDMQDLEKEKALQKLDTISTEDIERISKTVPLRSSIWRSRPSLLNKENFAANKSTLEKHVNFLKEKINDEHSGNKYFFAGLRDWQTLMGAQQQNYSPGSYEQMMILVQYCGRAWLETPGAMGWAAKNSGRSGA